MYTYIYIYIYIYINFRISITYMFDTLAVGNDEETVDGTTAVTVGDADCNDPGCCATESGLAMDPAAVRAGDVGDGEDMLAGAAATTAGGGGSEAASSDAVGSTGPSAAVTRSNGNVVAVSGAGGQLSIAGAVD